MVPDDGLGDPFEFSWAAGFFDGEGTTTFTRRGARHYPRVCVAQTNPIPLERFRRAVGVGTVHGPYVYGRTTSWSYVASSIGEITRIFTRIGPFLSGPKVEQASMTVAHCLVTFAESPARRPTWVKGETVLMETKPPAEIEIEKLQSYLAALKS